MNAPDHYPRLLRSRLEEALADSPVVLVHGPERSLETFVFQELRKQAGWQDEPVIIHHYRDKDQMEVDLVLESSGRLAGVEVKAGSTVTVEDFKGLQKLRDAKSKRFTAGVVLYDGESTVPFGPRLHAVPISTLWS